MDAALRSPRRPSADEQLAGLPLALAVDSRLVETPVKSNPQSDESAAAGDALKPETRHNQQVAVLCCLARVPAGGVLSRYEIHVRTTLEVTVLCFRLDELCEGGFAEKVAGACRSHKKPALKVAGYRITDQGRARVREVRP